MRGPLTTSKMSARRLPDADFGGPPGAQLIAAFNVRKAAESPQNKGHRRG